MVKYTSYRKFSKHFGERTNSKGFKEIRKDVFLRLILKDNGGKQPCLPFCWLKSGG